MAFSTRKTRSSRFSSVVRGSIGVSVEEGLVRSIAADAAGDEHNALYDKTLSRSSGAGLLFNQTIRRMSHAVMWGASDSVIMGLRRRSSPPPSFFLPALTCSARPPH